jgi:hypothetical protein
MPAFMRWLGPAGPVRAVAAYPDAALVSIAEFLAAHRALLTRYLTEVSPPAGNADPGSNRTRRLRPGDSD